MTATAQHVVHWPDYDIIDTEPGACDAIRCAACGAPMTVTRRVAGVAGRYMSPAAARPSRLHDVFVCPHAHTAWHAYATALLRRATDEVSATLRALIDAEREACVEAHRPPAEPAAGAATTAVLAGAAGKPAPGAARRHVAGLRHRHVISAGWQAPR